MDTQGRVAAVTARPSALDARFLLAIIASDNGATARAFGLEGGASR